MPANSDHTKPCALLIDIGGERSRKLVELLELLGLDLVQRSAVDASLYQLMRDMRPDIVFTDINSPVRDTLEHVVSTADDMPKAVVRPSGELRTALERLAGEIGISLYVVETVSAALLQALIDVTITHCHSIDVLEREIQLRRKDEPLLTSPSPLPMGGG